MTMKNYLLKDLGGLHKLVKLAATEQGVSMRTFIIKALQDAIRRHNGHMSK